MIKNLHLLCLLAFCALASCVKNDPIITANAGVSVNVINATDEVINFYLNGTRQNSVTGIYPLAANGNVSIPFGSHLFTFRKLFDNQNFVNADTLFTLPVQLDSVGSNTRYSIFTAGLTRSTAFVLKEVLEPDAKNAKMRFVVASPNTTGLRVFIDGVLFLTGGGFKSSTEFAMLAPGSQKVITILPATGTVPLYTATITLTEGRIYTLFSQGSGATFKAGLIINQ
jgi:hypothetical protein